jgi:cytochrome P450
VPSSDASSLDPEIRAFLEDFSFESPIWHERFYEINAGLRSHCPYLHSERGDFWVVSRYEDVVAVARDWKRFSSDHVATPLYSSPPDRPHRRPTETDPPYQRHLRQLLNPYFATKRVGLLEPSIRARANALIDGFVEDGGCDASAAYAHALPMETFFLHILNIAVEDLPEVAGYVHDAVLDPDPETSESGYAALAQWCHDILERRRLECTRKDDVIDAILYGELEGRNLEREEQDWTLLPLTMGGLDTSASVLSFGIDYLASHGDVQVALRANPGLIEGAVEEFLRLGAPAPAIRTASEAATVGGMEIRPGQRVMVSIAGANRDASQFPNPDTFEIDREARGNRHVAFGTGLHRCLGSNLARLTIRVGIEVLLERLVDIRIASGERAVFFGTALRSCRALPIQFGSAEATATGRTVSSAG